MSHHRLDVTEDLWFVAYTESRGIVHYGFAAPPATVTTGQENIETFITEAAMASKIDELKGIAGWYDAHKPADTYPPPNNGT